MRRFTITATVAALSLTLALPAQPAPPARAEVLVLGTYHMANPRRDLFNVEVDDALAPRRQKEIARVVEALKKFRPTKIAVEGDQDDAAIPDRYRSYLAGDHALTRSEVEQLGFRLAKELGHQTIYKVNVPGEFPFERVVEYAKTKGRSAELDAMLADGAKTTKALSAYLASHTVMEMLLLLNADASVAKDVGTYYHLAHFSEPGDWAGADLLSAWYGRNIRIYSNVVRLIESPHERVLVIFGGGHLGWLQHDVASDPSLRLRKFAEFAK